MPEQLSSKLSEQIQEWIAALPSGELSNWVLKQCKEEQMLPLHSTSIYIWGLRPDGQVLCMDHEAFGHPCDPETDPLTLYAVLKQGTRTYPELGVLIPPNSPGFRECGRCNGFGWVKLPETTYPDACIHCGGLGWV